MSNNNDELCKKLIDDDVVDEYDVDIEEQNKLLETAQATKIRKSRPSFSTSSGGCPCWCKCVGITLLALTTLGLVASGITYMYAKDAVQHLTVTTPHAAFPVVEMTDIQLKVVEDRVTLFVDELFARAGVDPMGSSSDDSSSSSSDSSSSSSDSSSYDRRRLSSSPKDDLEPLVITQDEINGFLGHSDYLRGNMFVTLEENVIREEHSLPTSMLPGGSGRYFVGEDHFMVDPEDETLQVEMTTAAKHDDWFDGPLLMAQLHYLVIKPRNLDDDEVMLQLYLDKGSIFGKDAPQDFIDQHKNLLEDVYGDSGCDHARAILQGIESVSIEDGKITIVPRKY